MIVLNVLFNIILINAAVKCKELQCEACLFFGDIFEKRCIWAVTGDSRMRKFYNMRNFTMSAAGRKAHKFQEEKQMLLFLLNGLNGLNRNDGRLFIGDGRSSHHLKFCAFIAAVCTDEELLVYMQGVFFVIHNIHENGAVLLFCCRY